MVDIKKFHTHDLTKGFIIALIGQDLTDIISAWIDFNKPLSGAIHDDTKISEVNVVQLLSEQIYKENSEIIEISEDEQAQCLIYKSDEHTVLFIIKSNWNVAIWNE